jgi:hypothetical protein
MFLHTHRPDEQLAPWWLHVRDVVSPHPHDHHHLDEFGFKVKPKYGMSANGFLCLILILEFGIFTAAKV